MVQGYFSNMSFPIFDNQGARHTPTVGGSALSFSGGGASNEDWDGTDGTSWSFTSAGLGALTLPVAADSGRFVVVVVAVRYTGAAPTLSATFNGSGATLDYAPFYGNNNIRIAIFSGIVTTGNDLDLVVSATQTCLRVSVRCYATLNGATASKSDDDETMNTGSGQTSATATVVVPTDGGAIFGGCGTESGGGCAVSGDITEDAVGAVEAESSFFNINGGLTNTDGSQDGTFTMSDSGSATSITSVGVAYGP